MNAVLLIYLWGIYDNILSLLFIVTTALIAAIVVLGMAWVIQQDEMDESNTVEIWLKRSIMALVASLALVTFIPSKNIAVMMYAAPTAIEALQNISDSNRTQTVINILDNSLNYLETKSKELK